MRSHGSGSNAHGLRRARYLERMSVASRWWCRSAVVALTMGVTGCGPLESLLRRATGGGDGTTQATAALRGLEDSKGANVDSPPPAPARVTRYLALRLADEDSTLGFGMVTPLEEIRGVLPGVSGKLMVNPEVLSEMTGLMRADLDLLTLYQRTRSNEQARFSAETRNTLQNEHARNWLEIGADVPEARRQANRQVVFRPTKIDVVGAQTLSALAKQGSSATLDVRGDLTLHGMTKPVAARLLVTADINNGQLSGLHFKTHEPIVIDLATFGIEARDGIGKLAQKTVGAFAPKVAKEAFVSIDWVARPHSM